MGNESSRGGGNGVGGKKGIVVVRDGTVIKAPDPKDDPEIKRLADMPRFLPILRTAIGRRDVCEHRDISPRPFLQLSLRLSNHFSLCAKAVSTKQIQLSAAMKTIDGRLSEMSGEIAARKKRLDRLCSALAKVGAMNEELQKMNDTFGALTASLEDLSLLLPPDVTLPPLVITPPTRHPLPPALAPPPAPAPPPPSARPDSASPSTSSPSPYQSSSAASTPSRQPSSTRDSPQRRLPPIEEVRVVDKTPTPTKR